MNIEEINNAITALENGETTFASCQKLATLYVVRDHLCESPQIESVDAEIQEILPTYKSYCSIKAQFQRHQLPPESVPLALSSVCTEIKDLILLIYSNSDMESERAMMTECLKSLWTSLTDR